jgi:hypothetical protein
MNNNSSLPTVYISKEAFFKAFLEVKKFYAKGLMEESKPWEAAMYPLAYLKLKGGIHKSPYEFVELNEIESVVVTQVCYPSDEYKDHSTGHAGFKKGANAYLNPMIEKLIKKYPLLDIFCKMHSHPLGGRCLSTGDLNFSIHNSYNWFQKKGLNTMFSFIISSDEKNWERLSGWEISVFGLNNERLIVELPLKIISSRNNLVKEAKSKPFYNYPNGQLWSKIVYQRLINEDYKFGVEEIRRGWIKYTFTFDDKRVLIIFPPCFPQQIIRVFIKPSLYDKTIKIFDLDRRTVWSRSGNDLNKYDLNKLIKKIRRLI